MTSTFFVIFIRPYDEYTSLLSSLRCLTGMGIKRDNLAEPFGSQLMNPR